MSLPWPYQMIADSTKDALSYCSVSKLAQGFLKYLCRKMMEIPRISKQQRHDAPCTRPFPRIFSPLLAGDFEATGHVYIHYHVAEYTDGGTLGKNCTQARCTTIFGHYIFNGRPLFMLFVLYCLLCEEIFAPCTSWAIFQLHMILSIS